MTAQAIFTTATARRNGRADSLDAALALVELGLSLIPLKPRGKVPAIGSWMAYQAARADAETIERWWTDNPSANIGVVTGDVSNLLVLDVDGDQGHETLAMLEAAHGLIPKTWRSRTGKGSHIWFEYPADRMIGNSARKLGSGLDTRGQGGYVVAPGSIHENGTTYTWEISPAMTALAPCPEWLVRLLDPPPSPPKQPPKISIDNRKGAYARRALESEFHKVASAPEGQRNHTLNRAAHSLGQLVPGGGLNEAEVSADLLKAAVANGLPSYEAERTIKSGLLSGMAKPREVLETNRAPVRDQASQGFAELDISLLNDGCIAPPKLALEHFGPWAAWIESTAECAVAPPDYVAGALLAATAAAIGNARWAGAWDGWSEPPCLWVALVGDPSSGKSPGADAVTNALRKIESEEFEAFKPTLQKHEAATERARVELARWKSDCEKAGKDGHELPSKPSAAQLEGAPIPPSLVLHDLTPEALGVVLQGNPRGVLVQRDELAGWLGSMYRYDKSGAARAFFIEAYGGRAYRIDRKQAAPILIPHLTISLLGGMQPDKFVSLVRDTDDDGLAARLLWLWPAAQPFRRPLRLSDNSRVLEALRRLRQLWVAGEPVVVQCGEPAADILSDWCGDGEASIRHSAGMLKSWRGKRRGHALRLALVLEHLWWSFNGHGQPPRTISVDAMMHATTLHTNYFDPMAGRVFGDTQLRPEVRHAAAVARWLKDRRKESFSIRELYKDYRVGGLREAEPAKKAVEELQRAGWVMPASGAKAGGRPEARCIVNPKVWSAFDGSN